MKKSLQLTVVLLCAAVFATVAMAQSTDGVTTSLLDVRKTAPAKVTVGDQIEVVTTVTAKQAVANVIVTDQVPAGARLVGTEPQAEVNGANVKWMVDTMDEGQTQAFKMMLSANAEGGLQYCGTVDADPRVCVATEAGKPMLEIAKTGPEQALLGENVPYNIVVRNVGTATARNVVITDTIPAGMSHSSGNKRVATEPVDLAPGASHQTSIVLTADQRGRHCNQAVAKGDNTNTVDAEACTLVVQRGLEIVKDTSHPTQYVPKTADYSIVVRNTGDVPLNNVVVTDEAPEGTSVVSAPGGNVSGRTVSWDLGTLDAGAQKRLAVTLRGELAGERCNVASVASAEGLSDRDQACTVWRGHPALLIEVVDDPDPLLPGETTTYTIRVTNQGSAPDTNVGIVVTLPPELSHVASQGSTDTSAAGKTVTMTPYPKLDPKQRIEWTVQAKAEGTGDARLKVALKSDLLKTPVNEEESTHVY